MVDMLSAEGFRVLKKMREDEMDGASKDKLIVEALGECFDPIFQSSSVCEKCRKGYWDHNPQLNTWPGFGWLWERAQKMEWWPEFLRVNLALNNPEISPYFPNYLIHPTRLRDALAEFLERR